MKRKTITGIIALMSLSLFGIIGLQVYWLNHAMQVRQTDFDRKVNDALAATAEKLEARETAQLVAQGMQLVSESDSIENSPVPEAKKPACTAAAITKQGHFTSANRTKNVLARNLEFVADTVQVHTFRKMLEPTDIVAFNNKLPGNFQKHSDSLALQPNHKIIYLKHPEEKVLVEMIRNNRVRFPEGGIATADSLLKKVRNYQLADGGQIRILQKSGAENAENSVRFNINEKIRIDTVALSGDITTWKALPGLIADSLNINTFFRRPFHETNPRETPNPARNAKVKPARKQPEAAPEKPAETAPVTTEELQQRQVVARRGQQLHSVMERMLVEMLRNDTPVEQRISQASLDSVLQDELARRQVQLPYHFFVIGDGQQPVMKLASAGYQPATAAPENAQYRAQLFPNALSGSNSFLLVNFTGRDGFVFQSMRNVFLLSGLFTLIILLTFSSTLFYIFRQKKLSDIKTDFINNMTHEFKTPIATISLAVNNINNPRVASDPERVRQYTHIINQENNRMNEHVERVLQAALLDKKLDLHIAPVRLHALVEKAAESMRLQTESRGGQIALQLTAANDLISGDAEHLLHVLLNLLDNANKYSPEAPEITVSTRSAGNWFYLSVADKGLGMSREVQKRIFEKFYRKPTGNLHNVKGFGLGLSYVKAIVEANGGTISVKSCEGKGSEFVVALPLARFPEHV